MAASFVGATVLGGSRSGEFLNSAFMLDRSKRSYLEMATQPLQPKRPARDFPERNPIFRRSFHRFEECGRKSQVAKNCVFAKSPFQTAHPDAEIEINAAPNEHMRVVGHYDVATDSNARIASARAKSRTAPWIRDRASIGRR
jgi:hypothetical protein